MALAAIPTTLISGFLGVGKTTALLHWLAQKPADEYWAILVNEFGEVGIDGALLKTEGVSVREIPGGCMCCVAGLPLQVGLNRLIHEAKPHRLLIEPTGLGHPAQILKVLTQPPYQKLLALQASITLVDPRKLANPQYADHETFLAQVQLADVLVANKTDLASAEDMARFDALAQAAQPPKSRILHTEQGRLPLELLSLPRKPRPLQASAAHQEATSALQNTYLQLPSPKPDQLFIRRENSAMGYFSCGWVFNPEAVFAMDRLFLWLSGLVCQRVKGVMITRDSIMGFNAEDGVLTVREIDECDDSRIEIIHPEPLPWDAIESILLACLYDAAQAD
jgi:G3E family GTPase